MIPLGSHADAPPIPIKRPATVFGSRRDAVRVHLDSSTVSKVHCVIVKNDWGCYIHDLGSRTHTLVNGRPVDDVDLKDGDTLQVGRFQFKFTFKPAADDEQLIAPPAALRVSTQSEPLAISKRVVVIGRRQNADLQLDDRNVSNVHAIVFEHNGRHVVRDMASRTGTWLDGKPVHQEVLTPQSMLRIGPATLGYGISLPGAAAAVAEAGDDHAPIALAGAGVADELELDLPLSIDAPADDEAAKLDLDDLLGLAPEPEKPADKVIPKPADNTAAEAPKPLPEPLELDPEPDGQPSEDGLASLRRGWRAPREALEPIELEPVAESPAAAPPEPAAEPEVEPVVEPVDELESIAAPAEETAEDDLAQPLADLELEADAPLAPADEAEAEEAAGAAILPVEAVETEEPADLETSEVEDEPEVSDASASAAAEDVVDAGPAAGSESRPVELEEPALDLAPIATNDTVVPVTAAAASVDADALGVDFGDLAANDEDDDEIAAALAEPVGQSTQAPDSFDAEEAAAETQAARASAEDEVADEELQLDLAELSLNEPAAEEAPPAVAETEPEELADEPALDLSPIDEAAPEAAEAPAELEPRAAEAPAIRLPFDPASEFDLDLEPQSAEQTESDESDAFAAPDEEVAAADVGEVEEPLDPEAMAAREMNAENEPLDLELDAPAGSPEDAAVDDEIDLADLSAREMASGEESLELDDLIAADMAAGAPVRPAEEAPVEIDLSRAQFTDDAADEADEAGEPAPVAELESIDFSHLDLDKPVVTDEAPIAADDAEDLIDEAMEEDTSARPLIDLADSVTGFAAEPELAEADADDADAAEVELIEEGADHAIAEAPDAARAEEDVFDADASDVDPHRPAPPVARAMRTQPATEIPSDSDIPAPAGGNLKDLIPADGPLIGGTFGSPIPSMLVGGSPVVIPSNEPVPPAGPAAAPGEAGTPPPERRRPLRVGFAGQQRPAAGSPFATGGERTIADVLIGRRAKASVDVFANPSPTPEDLLLEQAQQAAAITGSPDGPLGSPDVERVADGPPPPAAPLAPLDAGVDDEPISGEQREILELAQQFRPRDAQPDQPQQGIPPVYRPGDDPQAHAAARRRRIRGVFLCLGLMGTLIPASLLAIHKLLPPVSKLDALITFNGLDAQNADEIRQFRERQNEHVTSEATRQDAVAMLDKAIPLGFLDSTRQVHETLDRDPETRWPGNQRSVMRLRVPSRTDKEFDVARLRALAQAVINASGADRGRRESLLAEVTKFQAELETRKARLDAVKVDLTALAQLGNQALAPAQVNALQSERVQAEDSLRAVKSQRQELEATIDRLQRQTAETAAPATTEQDAAKADAELARLNQQLADLQKQGDAVRSAVEEKSAAARKQLDAVIGQFEQDLLTAQKLKDNPELQQYVEAAKRHFTQTRELTEQLIRRQENQRTRLTELKQRVSEKVDARTRELIEKDAELKRLSDTLAYETRKQNAALAEGLTEEARKLDLSLQLLRSLIAGREEQYRNDPIHNETITGLQDMIEKTEQWIRDDRKQVDEMLAKAQADFTKTAPAVEKLPAEQKALAEALDKKLTAVTEARRAYDATADSAQAEQAKLTASIKERMAELQREIATRKNDLVAAAEQQQVQASAAARQRQLADAQAQLKAVQEQETLAQANLDTKVKAIQTVNANRDAFLASDRKRDQLEVQRDELDREIRQLNAWLSARRAEMARLIVPDARPELQSYDAPDNRPMLMTLAGGGLLGLLLIPLVWNLLLLSRDAHHATPATPIGGGEVFSPAFAGMGANGHADADHPVADDRRGNGFDPILADDEPLEADAHDSGAPVSAADRA